MERILHKKETMTGRLVLKQEITEGWRDDYTIYLEGLKSWEATISKSACREQSEIEIGTYFPEYKGKAFFYQTNDEECIYVGNGPLYLNGKAL